MARELFYNCDLYNKPEAFRSILDQRLDLLVSFVPVIRAAKVMISGVISGS